MGAVRSDTGPFVLIPDWLLVSAISDKALRVYAIIARSADYDSGEAFPGRKWIAERLGCSVDTVDRAIRELVDVGALVVEARRADDGGSRSNRYVVLRARPGSRETAAGGSRETAAHNEIRSSEREGTSTESPSASPPTSSAAAPSEQKVEPRRRPTKAERDAIWQAVEAATGTDHRLLTKSENADVGRTVSEILGTVDGSPIAVLCVAERLREKWGPGVDVTHRALRHHWGETMRELRALDATQREILRENALGDWTLDGALAEPGRYYAEVVEAAVAAGSYRR